MVSVARSITRPLRLLTRNVLRATTDPGIVRVGLASRRDELGDIARASDTFLAELRRREEGWREAAQRADAALATLRQAQDDLVRSEKLASLGQLVAGVSHEISTPLGIALTTSTQVQSESTAFEALVNENRLSRSRLTQHAARMREGAQLMTQNLMRASDLLYSFKQVASDQVFEERRVIDLGAWIEELLRSLRALARPGRHEIAADCPEALSLDTYPGVLAQVLTNAVKNAIDHGAREGRPPEGRRCGASRADAGCSSRSATMGRASSPGTSTASSTRSSPPRAPAAGPVSACTSSTTWSRIGCTAASRSAASSGRARPCACCCRGSSDRALHDRAAIAKRSRSLSATFSSTNGIHFVGKCPGEDGPCLQDA